MKSFFANILTFNWKLFFLSRIVNVIKGSSRDVEKVFIFANPPLGKPCELCKKQMLYRLKKSKDFKGLSRLSYIIENACFYSACLANGKSILHTQEFGKAASISKPDLLAPQEYFRFDHDTEVRDEYGSFSTEKFACPDLNILKRISQITKASGDTLNF